jgi:hypothetical protein
MLCCVCVCTIQGYLHTLQGVLQELCSNQNAAGLLQDTRVSQQQSTVPSSKTVHVSCGQQTAASKQYHLSKRQDVATGVSAASTLQQLQYHTAALVARSNMLVVSLRRLNTC